MGRWTPNAQPRRPTAQGSPGAAPGAAPATPPSQYDLNTLPGQGQNYGGGQYQAPTPYNAAPIDPNNRSGVYDPKTGQMVNTYGTFEPESFNVHNPWGETAGPLEGLVSPPPGGNTSGTLEQRMQPGPGWVLGYNEAGDFKEWQEDPNWDSSGWTEINGVWYQTQDPNAPQATGAAGPPLTGGEGGAGSDFSYDQMQEFHDQTKDWFLSPTRAGERYDAINWDEDPFISTYGKDKLEEADEQTNLEKYLPGFYDQMPDLASDPGLAPYYEDAKRRVQESVDNWGASAGRYGTSAALEIGADEMARLEGERALNEANYALDRSAEQRGWVTDVGGLAGDADAGRQDRWEGQTDLASDISNQEWDQKIESVAVANGVDAGELGRLLGGATVAIGAETMGNAEKSLLLDSIAKLLPMLMQTTTDAYGNVIQGGDAAQNADIALAFKQIESELELDKKQSDSLREFISLTFEGYGTFK